MHERMPFFLLDVKEATSGADALFDDAIPIYMQFKVSQGLKSSIFPDFDFRNYFQLSALRRIQEFRRSHGLKDNPTLYFELRRKREKTEDFQHNVLLKLARNVNSYAFYVAPLSLQLNDYIDLLHLPYDRFSGLPFLQGGSYTLHRRDWISYFSGIPFLRGNISITPHEEVQTHEHYYSFAETGRDLAWHSPAILDYENNRLSYRLNSILDRALFLNEWKTKESIVKELVELNVEGIKIIENSNPLSTIQKTANILYEKYSISTFLLCRSKLGEWWQG